MLMLCFQLESQGQLLHATVYIPDHIFKCNAQERVGAQQISGPLVCPVNPNTDTGCQIHASYILKHANYTCENSVTGFIKII